MLERICPHLAMIGIHKNGTWAAQKIIECVTSPEEVALIAQNLRAYAPPLLLDQFGNYVIQYAIAFSFLLLSRFSNCKLLLQGAAYASAPPQMISSSTLLLTECGKLLKAALELAA